MDSEFIEVDGGQLYFEWQGSGPVIVLLHSGGMNRRMWDNQFENFATDYRVIRYDMRAVGLSEPPTAPFSHSADLYSLLEQSMLIGHISWACP